MKVTLHSDGRQYWVGDTMFSISRMSCSNRWRIHFSGEKTRQWVGDVCPHLADLRLTTLREAREYLEALFEVTPPPMEPVLPLNRLRPAGPGRYLATVSGERIEILRIESEGKRHWAISGREGRLLSLWEVRYLLGRHLP